MRTASCTTGSARYPSQSKKGQTPEWAPSAETWDFWWDQRGLELEEFFTLYRDGVGAGRSQGVVLREL